MHHVRLLVEDEEDEEDKEPIPTAATATKGQIGRVRTQCGHNEGRFSQSRHQSTVKAICLASSVECVDANTGDIGYRDYHHDVTNIGYFDYMASLI